MKTIALGVSAFLMAAGSATAADIPIKARPMPVVEFYNWTGFYAGVNVGYGWGRPSGDLVANSGGIAIPPAIAGGTIPLSFGLRDRGVIGGGQIGYNWQINNWVWGLEADIQGSGIKNSIALAAAGTPAGLLPTSSTASSQLDWFGTVRGRLGFVWNQFMIYGTGGVAYGHTSDNAAVATVPPPPVGIGSASSTRLGYAAGAGVEWAFASKWTAKAEYLHIAFGATVPHLAFASSPTDFLDYRFRHDYEIARFGINYRWDGGPVVARY